MDSWPGNMIKEKEGGGHWLQLMASCFGLCNLLSTDKVDPKARPTIKDSVGYRALVEKRNAKVFAAPHDSLFGEEEAGEPPARKARKLKDKLSPDQPLDIQLNDEGAILAIKSCARPTDDLVIDYTHGNVNMFFYYMQESGVKITTEGEGKDLILGLASTARLLISQLAMLIRMSRVHGYETCYPLA